LQNCALALEERENEVAAEREKVSRLTKDLDTLSLQIRGSQKSANSVDPVNCLDHFKKVKVIYGLLARISKFAVDGTVGEKLTRISKGIDVESIVNDPDADLFKTGGTVPEKYCKRIREATAAYDNVSVELDALLREAINNYEDAKKSVRVYVRIRPGSGAIKDGSSVVLENTTFGPFYDVYDSESTLGLFTGVQSSVTLPVSKWKTDLNKADISGIHSAFSQIESGYSIVLFGYGVSGSGKTHTLLGDEGSPGLLPYALGNLNHVSRIKAKYIFEQGVKKYNSTLGTLSGELIFLVNDVPNLRKFSRSEPEFVQGLPVDVGDLKPSQISPLIKYINDYRREKGRIKKTIFNKESSRTHLYLVFEITFTSGVKGYLTIIDAGGRESVLELYNGYVDTDKPRVPTLTTVLGPTGGPGSLRGYLRDPRESPEETHEVLKESIYINESLNHLVFFLNSRSGKGNVWKLQTNLANWSNDRVYIRPENETQSINTKGNVLVVPVMKWLDTLGGGKSSKFMVMVTLGKNDYDTQRRTLTFASSI